MGWIGIGVGVGLGLIGLGLGLRWWSRRAPTGTSDVADRLTGNKFRINAGLQLYKRSFGAPFKTALNQLGPGQKWLDAGAGEALAMKEYLERKAAAAATSVAIGYEKPTSVGNWESQHGDKFVYIAGRMLHQISEAEIDNVDLIVDFNGVLFYTNTLSEDLRKYLNVLTPNGRIFVADFYITVNGAEMKFSAWARNHIQGIQVTQVNDGIVIQKTGPINVPQLTYDPDESDMTKSPPDRHFTSG